jgi:hypothetical protein
MTTVGPIPASSLPPLPSLDRHLLVMSSEPYDASASTADHMGYNISPQPTVSIAGSTYHPASSSQSSYSTAGYLPTPVTSQYYRASPSASSSKQVSRKSSRGEWEVQAGSSGGEEARTEYEDGRVGVEDPCECNSELADGQLAKDYIPKSSASAMVVSARCGYATGILQSVPRPTFRQCNAVQVQDRNGRGRSSSR